MKLDKKLFGKKVYCKGYLERLATKYVYANAEHYKKKNADIFEDGIIEHGELYKLSENELLLPEDEIYIEQKTRRLHEHNFEGVIVGAKEVSTLNYYEQATCAVYDPVSLGYVDERYIDAIRVEKEGYVKCYVVYYANNKSRLVPIEMTYIEGVDYEI